MDTNVETLPASELSSFKAHIELYKFLETNIKQAVLSDIVPALKELQRDSHPPMRQQNAGGAQQRNTTDYIIDAVLAICIGVAVGALAYKTYKMRNNF